MSAPLGLEARHGSCGTEGPHRHNRPSRGANREFSESGRLEAQELEQVNDQTGHSPGRIRHSLAHDLVTRPHLDQHIFDARPLARLHASIQSGDRPSTAKLRDLTFCEE